MTRAPLTPPGAPRARRAILVALVALVACALGGCASTRPPAGKHGDMVGLASYYSREHHGRRTASGEVFDRKAMTAAHRTLPFGARVRVTNLENGRKVVVRVNDRGPFLEGRIIDLSHEAARRLDMIRSGTARVRLKLL